MDDWKEAGKIAKTVLSYGAGLIKSDAKILDVCEEIENKIFKLGAKCAFPVNVSINKVAAHNTALPDDQTIIEDGDLVKLDIGVSVNGAIGDCAITVDLGDNKKLVEASREALNEGIKIAKEGIKIGDIGEIIQKTIQKFGFSPIRNLSGHSLDRYKIHAGLTIPNYNNHDSKKLKKNMIIAIEPFATTGVGKVMEGGKSGIYKMEKIKPVRDTNCRNIIKYIQEEYNGLPFAARWICKKFKNSVFSLRLLEKEGIIKQYPQLVEESKGLVSQTEKTILVGEGILT